MNRKDEDNNTNETLYNSYKNVLRCMLYDLGLEDLYEWVLQKGQYSTTYPYSKPLNLNELVIGCLDNSLLERCGNSLDNERILKLTDLFEEDKVYIHSNGMNIANIIEADSDIVGKDRIVEIFHYTLLNPFNGTTLFYDIVRVNSNGDVKQVKFKSATNRWFTQDTYNPHFRRVKDAPSIANPPDGYKISYYDYTRYNGI